MSAEQCVSRARRRCAVDRTNDFARSTERRHAIDHTLVEQGELLSKRSNSIDYPTCV